MESVDTVAKSKQGSVDVRTFNHSYASIVSLRGSFRTSEVNK